MRRERSDLHTAVMVGPLLVSHERLRLWPARPVFYRGSGRVGVTFARRWCIQLGGFLR